MRRGPDPGAAGAGRVQLLRPVESGGGGGHGGRPAVPQQRHRGTRTGLAVGDGAPLRCGRGSAPWAPSSSIPTAPSARGRRPRHRWSRQPQPFGMPDADPGYFARMVLVHEVSAVTGACLAMRAEVFAEVGGFDARDLKVAFNDVGPLPADPCGRLSHRLDPLRQAGSPRIEEPRGRGTHPRSGRASRPR